MAKPTTNDGPVLSAVPPAVASATASGAATPVSLPPLDEEEREKSVKVSLADLTAKASALYLQKNYEEAAEVYAQASEMQAELNGEMNPENADILFLYGRSLFRVGQAKSDVLGTAGGEKKKPGSAVKPKSKPKKSEADSSRANATAGEKTEATKAVEEGAAKVAEEAGESEVKKAQPSDAKKPLFQFTGDEDFEDSDEEEEAEDEGEEEDDLAVAFEVLDLARVLFGKSLNAEQEAEGKGKEKANGADSPTTRHVKERLADTHDLLAEISLENEKYSEAINDGRASLNYKLELYPKESEIIAEAHFKLSLALEFASITTTSEEAAAGGPKQLDQGLRDEAAAELEKAIESTQLKLQNKEVELATVHAPEDNEVTREQIAEVKDLIADMEQRLVELRKPPMDVDSVLAANDPASGILGAALGDSSEEAKARVEEAKKNATDLTGLVRKKTKQEQQEQESKPETEAAPTSTETTNGASKRKAEESAEGADDEPKKLKVQEEAAVEP
ncbi:hypothetical protein DL766_004115 [Monosporascus sp. MC13-8B]|uniref:Tetratricopeptide SHNi-TPR domain-containing protein n=1 Tax=Monosporascus cannonballus TaxID=155416 RepID=A0ABY0HIA7_9PEZI|nr:hypothetical protein DL762_000808 [Monosporascus cannonballus]RYO96373.1 hypothetical protein DL763_003229 [Monosporascus cannonballus]RYP32108.1 hypothetical protein DL766_004115 [Monosporascus sp. MC13-8B]